MMIKDPVTEPFCEVNSTQSFYNCTSFADESVQFTGL